MLDTGLSKRTKHHPSNTPAKEMFYVLIECLMAFTYYQTRPNMIKHHQTLSNNTKQGVQTVKCLATKQCSMVFGRQTFIVCSGPKSD